MKVAPADETVCEVVPVKAKFLPETFTLKLMVKKLKYPVTFDEVTPRCKPVPLTLKELVLWRTTGEEYNDEDAEIYVSDVESKDRLKSQESISYVAVFAYIDTVTVSPL